jgi:hypothetical protein
VVAMTGEERLHAAQEQRPTSNASISVPTGSS